MSISSVSSFSMSLSYAEFSMTKSLPSDPTSTTGATSGNTPPASAPTGGEHHEHFMQALKITFIQVGISISNQSQTSANSDPGTNNLPAAGTPPTTALPAPTDTTNPAVANNGNGAGDTTNADANNLTQALQAFMHTLFQAMGKMLSEMGGEGRGEHEGDHDDDDRAPAAAIPANGYSTPTDQVTALLQSVKSDAASTASAVPADTTSPVTTPAPAATPAPAPANNSLDELKQAFQQLFDTMNKGTDTGKQSSSVTLQSFLESLVNNLTAMKPEHQSSLTMTGVFINITA